MSNIQHYVQQLNTLTSSTAESIIDAAVVLVEAKQVLKEDDYLDFLSQTKYDKHSSSLRKFNAIVNAQSRLRKVSHLLPASWTSIYKIATLSLHEFNILVEEYHLHPLVKAKEIDAATKNIQPKPEKMRISIELELQIDSIHAIKLIDDIKNSIPSYLFQIKLSENIKQLISN